MELLFLRAMPQGIARCFFIYRMVGGGRTATILLSGRVIVMLPFAPYKVLFCLVISAAGKSVNLLYLPEVL
ncbi:MAG: hypothetical protein IKJ97_03285 [Bacteroidaceae bacterium]|nr:hypothetical protein [Bacteroidaceae bacterium]